MAGVLEQLLQGVEDLRPGAQRLAERLRAHRQDHELLDVQGIVGVGAAVDDVHQRRRQDPRAHPAQVAVERQAGADGRGVGGRQAHREEGVGPQALLVLGAVELDHGRVERGLVERVEAGDGVGDLAVDRVDRARHAFAEVAALVAVAQLDRLARAGGGPRGHRGPAEGTAFQDDVGLDRRVAPTVQHLPAPDRDDLMLAHPRIPLGIVAVRAVPRC